ncbi:hypothetical protein [Inediibacterium massiliense]|uniref:hypothetical protein n=1 Tax=Inediibacterium massiliense TaxID=1658111 RepID=UPI0006B69107|nr:hypothetical protein [Inediibacterium massiliense]
MLYTNGNFHIESDFEIRVLREVGEDVDLLIPIEDRTLNLYMDHLPDYLSKKIQFPMIKNILIRFCTLKNNPICTIHFLRSIDIQSAIVNFEMDYSHHFLHIKNKEYSVELIFKKL